ncbi:MAG: exonuclease subunit SbcD, partial [Firmicutes bacterium]|nr:exonuclease subunit SbcD [Bacillota bacterium]
MILLHTSDWHLGASERNRGLKEDQRFFIDEICKIIKKENVDAVLIAGDVYDRSLASSEAIKLYDYAMTAICKDLNRQVLIIAGNHDSAERLASCSSLLAEVGLNVCGSLTREPEVVDLGDAEVFMLPWITEDKVKSIFPEKREEISGIEDAYRVVTDSFRERFTEGKRHIVLSHAFITNSETSTSDRAAEIGFATQVGASVFEGFDYVALGHIHKPQDVNDHVRYSGTPMPYSFGKEEKQEKSVTLIDTKDMSHRIVELPLLHKRTTIVGTKEELLHPELPEEVQNGYVHLKMTDEYVGLSMLSDLREIYPNLIEVEGKNFDSEDSTITLSMDEFERIE